MVAHKVQSPQSDLSSLEMEVMSVVWELGECSSREVIEVYNKRSKARLAVTTIRTVLSNLRKKGYLEPVATIERGFRLKPLVTRETAARRALGQLVSRLLQGSPSQAISYLLKEEKIGEEELTEIGKMIQEHKKARKTS